MNNEKLRCPFCGGETSEYGGDDGFVHKEDCALVIAMVRKQQAIGERPIEGYPSRRGRVANA